MPTQQKCRISKMPRRKVPGADKEAKPARRGASRGTKLDKRVDHQELRGEQMSNRQGCHDSKDAG
jgi:hypothetical protein